MQKMTQNEMVLDLLRRRGGTGLTPLEALELIGTMRLGARVFDVRETLLADDEEIVTNYVTQNGKTFARYVLQRKATSTSQLGMF
jgi:hypothetical protein